VEKHELERRASLLDSAASAPTKESRERAKATLRSDFKMLDGDLFHNIKERHAHATLERVEEKLDTIIAASAPQVATPVTPAAPATEAAPEAGSFEASVWYRIAFAIFKLFN
jgi:hypothetical protein